MRKEAGLAHSWADLGRRIRAVREERSLSLSELAERTGLSRGMISQLERGITTPSLGTLRQIGIVLHTPLSVFFEDLEPVAAVSPHVIRVEKRRSLNFKEHGIVKQLLSPLGMQELEAYALDLSAGAHSGTLFSSQTGEKFGVVLVGRLNLWLDGVSHTLERDDSFHFPAQTPHRFENGWKRLTRILWVISSPLNAAPAVAGAPDTHERSSAVEVEPARVQRRGKG